MKKQIFNTILIIIIPIFFVSCVSSLFKAKPPTFSDEIQITEPLPPFMKTETSVFPSWKNKATGNVIAIVSECNTNSANNNLAGLHQVIDSTLEDVVLIREESILLYNKPALLRTVHARLDGNPIEVQSAVFTKKSCSYAATLSGKLNNLLSDVVIFKKFINGFGFE